MRERSSHHHLAVRSPPFHRVKVSRRQNVTSEDESFEAFRRPTNHRHRRDSSFLPVEL